MASKRSDEEIECLVEGYRRWNGTRAEYCRQQGISISTLNYYQRRRRQGSRPRIARVELTPSASSDGTFVLLLRNGRRIESTWNFLDTDLARLIRVAEAE